MKAIPSRFERDANASLTFPKFTCVVIYEDFAAGERGARFYEELVASLDDDCISTYRQWSFSVLAIAEMRNVAASAAVAADVVIFALSGRDALPTPFKEWIEMWTWLMEDTHPSLVVLFESPNSESSSIRGYLRSLTASKHLDFFPDGESLAGSEWFARATRKSGRTYFAQKAWANEDVAACGTL